VATAAPYGVGTGIGPILASGPSLPAGYSYPSMRTDRNPSVERQIERLAGEVLPQARSRLAPDAVLADLGFDSLACADLALAVEERFGVRLVDTDVQEFRSLSDVAGAVAIRAHQRFGLPKGIGRSVSVARRAARPFLRWWFHVRVTGEEHVPAAGPVIVAANHRSMWDIPMLVIACPRRIVFMAKRELYKNALLNRLWLELGGFPVRRDMADLRAIDNALEVLDLGLALGIYPEGTRSFTGEMLPFLHGATWLALRTGAPIVPCAITGTARRTGGDQPGSKVRRRVAVTFGPAIRLGSEPDPVARRARAEMATQDLLGAITSLLR
jgi:1-acyl-sn-glycerol-3-phosphate acyltransferase